MHQRLNFALRSWRHLKQGLLGSRTLGHQVVTGAVWVYSLQLAIRGLSLIRTWILARLLAPEDFGIVGIATLATGILDVFSQTGFDRALIQKKELDKDYLDTAWTVSMMRGAVLCLILFLLAPIIAKFYHVPGASPIIRIVGLSFLAKGLNNIGVIFLSKELRFGRKFFYDVSVALLGFFVTIPLAFILRNEWALVWGLVTQFMARLIGSYIVDAYRPRMRLNLVETRELYSYGIWVFASAVVSFLARQGDSLVLPRILDTTVFGLYTMAFNIADLPANQVGVVSRVLFPTYSKLQGDLSKLRQYYLRSMRLISFLSVPACGGIFVLADPIVHILGDKWTSIVPVIRILSLSTMIRTIGSPHVSAFNALGRPHLSFWMMFVRALALAMGVYPLTMWTGWGMSGTATAVLLSSCVSYLIIAYSLYKIMDIDMYDWIEALLTPILATLAMAMIVHGLGLVTSQFQLVGLVCSIASGVAAYLGFVYASRHFLKSSVLDDIRLVLQSLELGKLIGFLST